MRKKITLINYFWTNHKNRSPINIFLLNISFIRKRSFIRLSAVHLLILLVGLCTMQKTNFKNNKFVFKGKSKKEHEKKLNNNHLIFINKLINLPGQNLFKYLGKNNEFININSNDLNNFLKKYIDENMTSKDIRTYYANQIFKKKYKELLKNNDSKPIINAIKFTASELGNTPKVCKDSYINPNLII